MKSCSSKLLIFTIAFLTGAAMVAFFEGHLSFQPVDALKAPGEGEHYCSFETAEEDQTLVDQQLLAAIRKWNEKEVERFIRIKKLTAKGAAEVRKQMYDPNLKVTGRQTIALVDAQCRREGLSPFQCRTKKEAAVFDIEKNVLPRVNSFPNEASYNKWRLKRKMDKQTAEVLFDENAGLGKM